MNQSFIQFKDQTFLNLETFRNNGTGVKTPVWFVEEGEHFYVRTLADSWKVRRILNNPKVKVVPCKAQGQPVGEWVSASAHQIENPVLEKAINQQFSQKYGLQKRMFDLMGKIRRHQMTTLEIKLSNLKFNESQ
jgi:PPOX class probable F420-dependent enzyme